MRHLLIVALVLLSGCSSDSAAAPMVSEVETSLATLARDTATLTRKPGTDLFIEAHSDSTGYRRIRITESGSVRRASATAYYDARGRVKVVRESSIGLNPGETLDRDRIEELAEMAFGPQGSR